MNCHTHLLGGSLAAKVRVICRMSTSCLILAGKGANPLFSPSFAKRIASSFRALSPEDRLISIDANSVCFLGVTSDVSFGTTSGGSDGFGVSAGTTLSSWVGAVTTSCRETGALGRSLIILFVITLSPALSPSRITQFVPIQLSATTGRSINKKDN